MTYDPNPDKPVVYVAGPYSATDVKAQAENVLRAVEVASALFDAGYFPFCPHSMGWQISINRLHRDKEAIPWETWMDWGSVFLVSSQAVYVIDDSPGTRIEVRIAKELGIPVVYTIEELEDVFG